MKACVGVMDTMHDIPHEMITSAAIGVDAGKWTIEDDDALVFEFFRELQDKLFAEFELVLLMVGVVDDGIVHRVCCNNNLIVMVELLDIYLLIQMHIHSVFFHVAPAEIFENYRVNQMLMDLERLGNFPVV